VHTYYAFVLPWYPRARARNHPTHIVCMRIRLTPHTPRPQLVAAAASTRTGARRMSSLVAPLASGLGDKNGANIVQNVSTLFATLPGGNAPVRAELTEVLGKGVERDYMDKTWAGVNGATVKKRGNVQKAAPVLRIKYHSEVRQHNKKTQFSRKHSLENILVHAILLHLRRPHKKPSRVLLAAYGGGKYGGADNCYIPSDAR
jgi:hypothetical protein